MRLQCMHVLFKLLHELTNISNGKTEMYTAQMPCLRMEAFVDFTSNIHIRIQLKSMLHFHLLNLPTVLHILTFGKIDIQFK